MTSPRPPNVELLVHVCAPTSTAHDGLYRQLAQAYLGFDAARRIPLRAAAPPQNSGQDDADDNAKQTSGQHPEHHAALLGLDTQNLSFASASDNLSSPPLRTEPAARLFSPPALQSSLCPLPSQVGDSYPMPGLDLVETTSAAVLEHYLCSQTRQSPQDARPQHRPSAALDSLPSRLVHGVIPVTPISLPSLARKRKTPPDEQDTSLFDVTHISSSSLGSPSPSSPPRAESEPPLSTRPPSVPVPDSKLHLAPSSDDLGLARFCQPAARDRDDIMPPSPPTGIRPIHPQDLISDELAKLAQHLSSRFRPVYSRPPTEPLERGYWLINCSLWPRPARHAMWTFLENYLSSGLAGWGVWCRRRRSEASTPNCTTTGTDDDADANDDWIRLYCWACVVKHMYLLLYLASDRRLKTTHAAWIGADGDTVLEVLPSDYRA